MIYQTYQWGGGYSKSEVDTLLTGKSDTGHTHTKSDITDFPTIPCKTSDLTNDSGFITSEIDSMGEGWVRFKSGLQICYGTVQNNNNLANGIARFSFPKVFSAISSLTATPNNSGKWVITCVVESGGTWVLYTFGAWMSPIELNGGSLPVYYMAIGKWK